MTGDTHGNWMKRLNVDSFPEQKEMTKEDIVVVAGDYGLWDDSKSEKYALDWLEDKPFTTVFVDGNHENHDMLDSMPVEEWHGGKVHFIRPSIIHLMRGQVYEIEDKTFFTFGGASSHDIRDGILEPSDPHFKRKKKQLDRNRAMYRINHVSWWKRELPNQDEMDEGLANLEKYGNKVDYIVTHSPYTSVMRQMDGGSGLYKKDVLTDYLQKIKQTVDFQHWFFGHMHVNKTWYWEKSSCIYEQIIRIL